MANPVDVNLLAKTAVPVLGATTGNDTINGTSGSDKIEGRAGNDVLRGKDGSDYIAGGAGNDTLYGGRGNDALLGGVGNDDLHGDKGNNYLDGGAGNDTLRGSTGDDWLIGGAGNDLMYGGKGADQFRFYGTDLLRADIQSGPQAKHIDIDKIFDLNFGDGDKLVFDHFDVGTFVNGGDKSLQVVSNGAGAIVDSYHDIARLLMSDAAHVSVSQKGTTGVLILSIHDQTHGTETLHLTDASGNGSAWNQFQAALKDVTPPML
ncbi:MAG: calcium-binding protein [Methylobacterium frigidaeris]